MSMLELDLDNVLRCETVPSSVDTCTGFLDLRIRSKDVKVPVRVLLRTSSNDMLYSSADINPSNIDQLMSRDVSVEGITGVQAAAIVILTTDKNIDQETMSSTDEDSETTDSEDTESSDDENPLDPKDEGLFCEATELLDGGMLEMLKVHHCKAYLRKHRIRLAGKKQELLERIQEHKKLKQGCGEAKYPRATFVVDCTGDACIGDMVLFEQKVYKKYDLASRSSRDSCLGIRTVAGRILKESYGAGKQQHTFTLEVLWSTGVKPLGPLRQVLIKGRNLYRSKTFRQPWTNEEERRKILYEKHCRGREARLKRAATKCASQTKGGQVKAEKSRDRVSKISEEFQQLHIKENQPHAQSGSKLLRVDPVGSTQDLGGPKSWIRMNNVPYSATKEDIRLLFVDYQVAPDGIHILMNAANRPSGIVFVEFYSAKEANRALAQHGKWMGPRRVYLHQVNKQVMSREIDVSQHGGSIPVSPSPGRMERFTPIRRNVWLRLGN